jgi:hypothetical protein
MASTFFAELVFFVGVTSGATGVSTFVSRGTVMAAEASFCTSAKMRRAAMARLANFLTGVTPVRPFQISTSRLLS